MIQKELGFLEVRVCESFGEPAVGRRKEIPGALPLAALGPQPCEVARCPQLQRRRRLVSGYRERLVEVGFCRIVRIGGGTKGDRGPEPVQIRQERHVPALRLGREGRGDRRLGRVMLPGTRARIGSKAQMEGLEPARLDPPQLRRALLRSPRARPGARVQPRPSRNGSGHRPSTAQETCPSQAGATSAVDASTRATSRDQMLVKVTPRQSAMPIVFW